MVKRYKRIIYTFKNSIEVYEYLDGKYGGKVITWIKILTMKE